VFSVPSPAQYSAISVSPALKFPEVKVPIKVFVLFVTGLVDCSAPLELPFM